VKHQYRCTFCTFSLDDKSLVEQHCGNAHKKYSITVLKTHFVDPTTSSSNDTDSSASMKRLPLWSRNMEGLKHIRGILYDEEKSLEEIKFTPRKPKKEKFEVNTQLKIKKEPVDPADSISSIQIGGVMSIKQEPGLFIKEEPPDLDNLNIPVPAPSEGKTPKIDIDFYPSQCKECQMDKKTVTGLKMHIKLMHLGQGRYVCRYCSFTANLKKPMTGHTKSKHADQLGTSSPDDHCIERTVISENYSQEYWKTEWNIPTTTERREMLAARNPSLFESPAKRSSSGPSSPVPAKKSKMAAPSPSKRGRKRKLTEEVDFAFDPDIVIKEEPLDDTSEESNLMIASVQGADDMVLYNDTSASPDISPSPRVPSPTKTVDSQSENSPFENIKTFMCTYCPKRSQCLEKIQRHLQTAHPKEAVEYRELTRDQVVAIITRDQTNYGSGNLEYKCFYCEYVGDIMVLQKHSHASHLNQTFRVIKCQNKNISGYLECQLCGHLTQGFEKSGQKAHFHEEHPLENEVICSKYVFKHKLGPDAFVNREQTFKIDVRDLEGLEFSCPMTSKCPNFTTKSLPQMNSHLRKHTRTYKCGHCGKTLPDSQEFHRHSALSHGDKIPDLVKDPEAEAEFEALKGVFEWGLQKQIELKKSRLKSMSADKPRSATARKSTSAECRASAADRCRNVARKSTGSNSRCWPETRLTEPYSFYREVLPKIEFKKVKTKMIMTGVEITLDVEKMSQLVNIQTELVLKDVVKESMTREEVDL